MKNRPEYNRAYWAKNRARLLPLKTASAARRYERNVRFLVEYLRRHPCPCGEADPIVLQFDHRDRSDKSANVSDMAKNASLASLKREIVKCDVLCANCHQRRTAMQLNFLICQIVKG